MPADILKLSANASKADILLNATSTSGDTEYAYIREIRIQRLISIYRVIVRKIADGQGNNASVNACTDDTLDNLRYGQLVLQMTVVAAIVKMIILLRNERNFSAGLGRLSRQYKAVIRSLVCPFSRFCKYFSRSSELFLASIYAPISF